MSVNHDRARVDIIVAFFDLTIAEIPCNPLD